MTYEVQNKLLLHLGDWAINEDTLRLVKESIPVIKQFYDKIGEPNMEYLPIHEIIDQPVKETFTAPIFSEALCKVLKKEIQHMGFVPNPDEDELRQIPEFVFKEYNIDLHNSFMNVVKSIINPILVSLWQRPVSEGNIQIARYNPKGKKKGAWHHDASSDFTVVVPLNTGEYEGGGTEFFGRGIVPPLENGSGLFFPGLTHMHRGLAVDKGDRYLLVFWLKCGEQND